MFLNSIKQNKEIQKIWLYIRCLRRFGLLRGNKIFFQLGTNPNNNLVSLRVPGYEQTIFIRPKTSDASVFETVFIALRFKNITETLLPSLIIDAGANIGLVSVYFANKYPSAVVYAIEPESSNYDLLLKNTNG